MENYPYKLWIWIFSFKFSSMFHLQDTFLIYAYLSHVYLLRIILCILVENLMTHVLILQFTILGKISILTTLGITIYSSFLKLQAQQSIWWMQQNEHLIAMRPLAVIITHAQKQVAHMALKNSGLKALEYIPLLR